MTPTSPHHLPVFLMAHGWVSSRGLHDVSVDPPTITDEHYTPSQFSSEEVKTGQVNVAACLVPSKTQTREVRVCTSLLLEIISQDSLRSARYLRVYEFTTVGESEQPVLLVGLMGKKKY